MTEQNVVNVRTKNDVTIEAECFKLSGRLEYEADHRVLQLNTLDGEFPEVLNIRLDAYGLETPEGTCWIKDWSEHSGVTQALVEADAVTILRSTQVGPFDSTAHLVKIEF